MLAAERAPVMPARLRVFDPVVWGAEAGASDVDLRAARERYVDAVDAWCRGAGLEVHDRLRTRADARVVAAGGLWGQNSGPAQLLPGDDEWPPADDDTKG